MRDKLPVLPDKCGYRSACQGNDNPLAIVFDVEYFGSGAIIFYDQHFLAGGCFKSDIIEIAAGGTGDPGRTGRYKFSSMCNDIIGYIPCEPNCWSQW